MITGIFKSKLHAKTVQLSQQMSKFCCKNNISRHCKRSNVSRCVIASFVDTSLYTMLDDWLNRPALDCHLPCPVKDQMGNYWSRVMPQCRASKTVARQNNAHFAFHCVRYSWESQKSRQIPRIRIRPYFKVIPGRVRVMLGSAIPGRNWVVAGYPSHL